MGRSRLNTAGIKHFLQLRSFSAQTAQKRLKHALLFHGTLLYNFDIARIGHYLQLPKKQPEYRDHRRHEDFVTNLPCTAHDLKRWIEEAWHTHSGKLDINTDDLQQLAHNYTEDQWIHKF